MRRRPILLAFTAGLALALAAGCAAYRHQHGPAPAASPASAAPASRPAAEEFQRLGTPDQLATVRGEVAEVKRNLAEEGRYNCCIEPSCNECLLRDGECHCRQIVEKEGPCCGECTEGWIEGRGAVEGLNALELLRRKQHMLHQGQPPADSPQP